MAKCTLKNNQESLITYFSIKLISCFSNICVTTESDEIGHYLSDVRLSLPSSTGVTLKIFRTSATIPFERELLKVDVKALLILVFASFISFCGYANGGFVNV